MKKNSELRNQTFWHSSSNAHFKKGKVFKTGELIEQAYNYKVHYPSSLNLTKASFGNTNHRCSPSKPVISKMHLQNNLFQRHILLHAFKKNFCAELGESASIEMTTAYPSNNVNDEKLGFKPELFSSDWIMNDLLEQLKYKKNIKTVLNQFMNQMFTLMRAMGAHCPIQGIQISATGRIGNQKKGMSQKIRRSVGRVPLASFREKVDYSQAITNVGLGAVGLKVWICYK